MSRSQKADSEQGGIEFATTPVSELRKDCNGSGVTISQWEDEHDVFAWLLPLRHREFNALEIALTVADKIASYEKTVKTFTRQTMGIGKVAYDIALPILRVHNVTPVGASEKRARYLNPNYLHYTHTIGQIGRKESKLEFYNKYAPLGTASRSWLASHLGLSPSELTAFIEREAGHSPQHDITGGKRRLARTVVTVKKWTNRAFSQLAHAIGVPRSTLYGWRKKWVIDSEWIPPERPVGEPWFDPTHSIGQSELEEIRKLSDSATFE